MAFHGYGRVSEVSMAICRAGAAAEEVPLYQPLAKAKPRKTLLLTTSDHYRSVTTESLYVVSLPTSSIIVH